MSGKTGGTRGLRRAAALAVAAAVAVLTAGCGIVHVHFGSSGGSASTGSAAYRAELAYTQCMRAHGLPGFPNPILGGGGVSVAAPLWAAVIALADQYAGRDLGYINPALYRIGRSAYYHRAFHDVTTGTNTVNVPAQTITGYQAAPGWDPVTGWGSPNAQVLVPLLAHYASP